MCLYGIGMCSYGVGIRLYGIRICLCGMGIRPYGIEICLFTLCGGGVAPGNAECMVCRNNL